MRGEGARVIGSGKFFSIYSEWDGSHWCVLSCAATVAGSRRAKVEAERPMRQLFTIPGWRLGCLGQDLPGRGGRKLLGFGYILKGEMNNIWIWCKRECQHWLHQYLDWTIRKMRMSFIEKKDLRVEQLFVAWSSIPLALHCRKQVTNVYCKGPNHKLWDSHINECCELYIK